MQKGARLVTVGRFGHNVIVGIEETLNIQLRTLNIESFGKESLCVFASLREK
jgi:hypothetical protein